MYNFKQDEVDSRLQNENKRPDLEVFFDRKLGRIEKCYDNLSHQDLAVNDLQKDAIRSKDMAIHMKHTSLKGAYECLSSTSQNNYSKSEELITVNERPQKVIDKENSERKEPVYKINTETPKVPLKNNYAIFNDGKTNNLEGNHKVYLNY